MYAYGNNADGTPNVIKGYDEIRNNFFIGNYYGQEVSHNAASKAISMQTLNGDRGTLGDR